MKTHNINPHAGGNKPHYSQIHGRAMLGKTITVRGAHSRSPKKKPIKMIRKPVPPRVAPPRALTRNIQSAKAAPQTVKL